MDERAALEQLDAVLAELDELADGEELDEFAAELEDAIFLLECAEGAEEAAEAMEEIAGLAHCYSGKRYGLLRRGSFRDISSDE